MAASLAHSESTDRPLRRLLLMAAVWTVLVLALVGWWSWVLRKQADRIAELEGMAGVASAVSAVQWNRTHRMLVWESWTFALLLLAVSGVLIWLYWRDSMRSRSLQAFFASVTHELKTPLTSIRLQAESIGEQGPSPKLIGRLLEDTSRLEGQVERTLELARLEGGGKTATQSLPLKSWLDRSVDYLTRSYNDRISVKMGSLDADLLVKADPTALQIILRNLVENSVRYSGKTPVQIALKAERRDSKVVLTYADNGTGFTGSSEKLGQLFFRGDTSQGAGVGLYLIRALMERMSGQVIFETAAGGGFTANLWFAAGD